MTLPEPMSDHELDKCRTARFLLEPPAPEVVGQLIAKIDELRAELNKEEDKP